MSKEKLSGLVLLGVFTAGIVGSGGVSAAKGPEVVVVESRSSGE